MSRHECQHETPLRIDFGKLPSSAECEEPHCYWQRYATEATPETLAGIRSLATHHAKALRHKVVIHLRQEVRLVPQGSPLAVGGEAVPRLRAAS